MCCMLCQRARPLHIAIVHTLLRVDGVPSRSWSLRLTGRNEFGDVVFQTLLDNPLDDRLGFRVLGAVGRAHGRGNVDAVVGGMSNDVVVVVEEGQL